jgi:ADP-ribose pyrophosphatase
MAMIAERIDFLNLEEKTIAQEIIYNGRFLTFACDKVALPNGKEGIRETVSHPGGVGVLPLTEEHDVLLVNQFRYPYRKEILEIPAGKLSVGEEPLECGKRELKEETGATALDYKNLGQLLPSPGYTNEIIYLYLATGLSFGEMQLDEDEFLDVVRMPLKKAVELVLSGELADSKTQVAILKTWYILQQK